MLGGRSTASNLLFLFDIPKFLDPGRKSWTLNSALCTLDAGRWTLNSELWTLDPGCLTLDSGRWTLDSERWTLDAGRYS